MKNTLFTLLVLVAVAVGGCTNHPIETPENSGDRVITITSSMPGESNSTKMALTQEGKNMNLTWEEGDQIQLCVAQNGVYVKQIVTIHNISVDKKTAAFTFILPSSFSPGTFDLYGVFGGDGLATDQPNIASLPSLPGNNGTLSLLQSNRGIMLKFKKLSLDTADPNIQILFEHVGSLFCIKLKNTGTIELPDVSQLVLSSPLAGWAYNTGNGGATYDLITDSFVTPIVSHPSLSFTLPGTSLPANGVLEFWAWYVPNSLINCPPLQLILKDASLNPIAVSSNTKPARTTPLVKGKFYSLYAAWNGTKLEFTDSVFVAPPTLVDLSITGDLVCSAGGSGFIGMVYNKSGVLYYNAASTAGIWLGEESLGTGTEARMDIDNNGYPHIVFTSSDNKIAYLKKTASGWTSIAYIATKNAGVCSKPDIAVDANGFAHITYTDSQGNLDLYTRDDIMYAVNSSGSFISTLKFDGTWVSWGGSDYSGDTYGGGSFIELDNTGSYYIMTYYEGYARWGGSTDRTYCVKFLSGTGASGTSTVYYAGTTAQGSRYASYDLTSDGNNVFALYRDNNTNVTAKLSMPGTTITPIEIQTISTTITPVNIAAFASSVLTAGVAGTNLFSKYDNVETTYTGVTAVKNNRPNAVMMNGNAYLLYTNTSTGKVMIQKAITP